MSHTHPTLASQTRRRSSVGFTLVELMIAIGIILLMLGLAMPAFRVITGGRSEEGASNMVAAMLNRARADAVGLQVPRGVAVCTDATGQCRLAEVGPAQFTHFTAQSPDTTPFSTTGDYKDTAPYPKGTYVSRSVVDPLTGAVLNTAYYICTQTIASNVGAAADLPTQKSGWVDTAYWHVYVDNTGSATGPAAAPAAAYYSSDYYFAAAGLFYDQLPDTDTASLPVGVGAQVIAGTNVVDTSAIPSTKRNFDGYLHDGVLLFDATGRVVNGSFVLSRYGLLGGAVALTSSTGTLLNVATYATKSPEQPAGGYTTPQPVPTSFGLVLFDRDAHDNQKFPAHDVRFDNALSYGTAGSSTLTPADEEAWLDVNATPLLINRYNGTLIKAE